MKVWEFVVGECLTSNVLGSDGNVNVQKLFNGQRIALFVAHHRDVIQAGKEIGFVEILPLILKAS